MYPHPPNGPLAEATQLRRGLNEDSLTVDPFHETNLAVYFSKFKDSSERSCHSLRNIS